MKRLVLFSALFTVITLGAFAQRGHHHHGGNHVHSNVYVVPRPSAPVVVYRQAPVYAPICTPAPVYYETLNDNEFNYALSSIHAQSFDDGRMGVATQIMNFNYLYSWQVREIMLQFVFESSRLQFAKMAYGRTLDKENYYMVNDAFTFGSSVRDLNNYIF